MRSVEYFDVLNEDGTPTGDRKLREEVHRDGDWHGGSHIWVVRRRRETTRLQGSRDGFCHMEVLLQKRSMDKDSFPGYLDSSCAGHVDAGESFLTTAVREMEEELGLAVKEEDLIFLFRQTLGSRLEFHGKPFYNREINDVYLLKPDFPLDGLRGQEEEIMELVWMDADELRNDILADAPGYCIWKSEYEQVYEAAGKILQEMVPDMSGVQ